MTVGITQYTSCSLYGNTSYASGWLGINSLVILTGFAIISVVYMASRFMPASARQKMTAITRIELVELMLSGVIIAALVVFSSAACSLSSSISQSSGGISGSPFVIADSYIANLTFNRGLGTLTDIYSLSIGYAIDSNIWSTVGGASSGLLEALVPPVPLTPASCAAGPLNFCVTETSTFGADLGVLYGVISDLFISLLAPLMIASIALLFVQWISIPFIEATAFVVVLPVAIALRSFAYAAAGNGLRNAANAILAIAIAAYLIYPVMISFDPCIMAWIQGQNSCFGPASSNPASQYLPSYASPTLSATLFNNIGSGSIPGFSSTPSIGSLVNAGLFAGLPALDPASVDAQIIAFIAVIGQFIFQATVLFGIDIAITIAFAMGLARALNSGILGQSPFW